MWINGQTPQTIKWSKGQPNNFGNNDHCSLLADGYANDVSVSKNQMKISNFLHFFSATMQSDLFVKQNPLNAYIHHFYQNMRNLLQIKLNLNSFF